MQNNSYDQMIVDRSACKQTHRGLPRDKRLKMNWSVPYRSEDSPQLAAESFDPGRIIVSVSAAGRT
jgi:hypothetical protein